jgi:ankyrin repeat protein
LNRADARWKLRDKNARYSGDYYATLARDDYRQYCARRIAANEAIPDNIATRIKSTLNVDVIDNKTCRPQLTIFSAIEAGDLQAVKAELAAGTDPNVANENRSSPLAVAVFKRNLDITKILLAAGANAKANVSNPLLYYALPDANDTRPKPERFALADILIAAGAPMDGLVNNDEPLLMHLTGWPYGDNPDSMNYLLEHGANPNARAKDGRTVLHAATERSKTLWFAEKLLAKGADINAAFISMYYGNKACWQTPLLQALMEKYESNTAEKIVRFLLDHGADPTVGGCSENRAAPEHNGMEEALEMTNKQPALAELLKAAAEKQKQAKP